ncbi:MAG: hypothetical protein MUF87_21630 [Anaerolineae bacterium]|nr:hypothetical protein [Anaerolineae bacterium]
MPTIDKAVQSSSLLELEIEGQQTPDTADLPEVIQALMRLIQRIYDDQHEHCPTCGEAIDHYLQVENRIYARPCGHPVEPK